MASNVLAKAHHEGDIWPHTYPQHGVARRGASAAASVRLPVAKSLVPVRTGITRPHHNIVLDPTLIRQMNLTQGRRPGDLILKHSTEAPAACARRPEPECARRAGVVPAHAIESR